MSKMIGGVGSRIRFDWNYFLRTNDAVIWLIDLVYCFEQWALIWKWFMNANKSNKSNKSTSKSSNNQIVHILFGWDFFAYSWYLLNIFDTTQSILRKWRTNRHITIIFWCVLFSRLKQCRFLSLANRPFLSKSLTEMTNSHITLVAIGNY